MTELLELVLELVGGMAEWFCSWRFLLCVMAALALVAGICHMVSDDTMQVILSLPVIAIGVIAGLVWEFRSAE